MLKIERHNIEFTRRESVRFSIRLNGREMPGGTAAIFACKETLWAAARPCIEKVLAVVYGKVHVILTPYDMDVTTGSYYLGAARA